MSDRASIPAPRLSLAIPCYNEEASIGHTAPAVVRAFQAVGVDVQLVLVDNGSTDGTARVIDELIRDGLPARKVSIPVNEGYSNGILRGLEACTAPVLGFLHADGQVAPEDVVLTYRLMENREQRVLAKVRRRFRQDNWKRKIVSIIYNGMMQVVFGWLGAIDINGSPKIFSRANFDKMRLESRDWFLDPEIILKAKWLGLRVIEIDVEGHARHGGTSHVRRETMLEFLKNIWRYRMGSRLRDWHRGIQERESRQPAPSPAATAPDGGPPEEAGAPHGDEPFRDVRIVEQNRFEDARGFLQKVLTASQIGNGLPAGEVYVTAAHPGEVKGNHFHRRMGEWFSVVQGDGSLELCDPASGARRRIPLQAEQPRTVYVPPGIAHAVVNRGAGLLICVACAETQHDPRDVFAYTVCSPEPGSPAAGIEARDNE